MLNSAITLLKHLIKRTSKFLIFGLDVHFVAYLYSL